MEKTYTYQNETLTEIQEGIFKYSTTYQYPAGETTTAIEIYDTETDSGEFIVLTKNFNTNLFENNQKYYFYYTDYGALVKISNGKKLIWSKK